MISVICPTFDRPDRHANLYAAFAHQTYVDRELLVLDDSHEASPFFLKCGDPRVRYWRLTTRATIGAKRNMLVERARGTIVAHFDDDDFYREDYLQSMVGLLGDGDLAKLSSWLAYRELDGSFWRWDTRRIDPKQYRVTGDQLATPHVDFSKSIRDRTAKFVDETMWGFGFSYVYRKELWERRPFEDVNHGEDTRFAMAARSTGAAMLHAPDDRGVVLHTLHPASSSLIYPQEIVSRTDAMALLGRSVGPWIS